MSCGAEMSDTGTLKRKGENDMTKKKMEKLGIETSLLGFGCMRFPVTADGEINEPEAERMLDRAIAAGVNYIDTAYPYHGGKSETFVGKALRKYDRSSFYLATKLPCWNVQVKEDAAKLFQEQLGKLQTDYIDFYLMHAMNKEKFHQMVDYYHKYSFPDQKQCGYSADPAPEDSADK